MDASWFFVLASAIAVYGILFSFRGFIREVHKLIEKGEELSTDNIRNLQSSFFIKVAMVEAIPIILLVLGFMNTPVESNPLVPAILIGAFYVSALIQIMVLKQETIQLQENKSSTSVIQTLTMIGLTLTGSIPLISIIALYMS
ncbi:hypothetical protein KO561_11055 [Radiobacillus kanasensis]|uniref:hypothetical protein n=1 Tax=Radiobacillus kanasensis TaxID=2844358 RepID=UPI001E41EF5B|nr:hypothetical protein [Radiobacillus kanasensis]UFT97761.1 hypothetical protein KO561_11055 [Radiobacillus kanasensis]